MRNIEAARSFEGNLNCLPLPVKEQAQAPD
jgi:hypothetical protein